jgi:hypothetical protein
VAPYSGKQDRIAVNKNEIWLFAWCDQEVKKPATRMANSRAGFILKLDELYAIKLIGDNAY